MMFKKNTILRLVILICLSAALTFIPMILMNTLFNVDLSEILYRAGTMLLLMITLQLLNLCFAKTIFRIPGIILSGGIFFAAMILQILEFYNFATVGTTFGLNFYATMLDYELILALAPSQAGQITVCLLYLLFSSATFCGISVFISNLKIQHKNLYWGTAVIFLAILGYSICCLPNPLINFIRMFNLAKVQDISNKIDLEELKKYGITHCATTKETLKIYDKGIGKNLVFIILESMEKNFLDEELFPGLTPNLNRFRKMPGTLFFDDITDSGGFTNGAMFQMIYGMPPTPLTLPLSLAGSGNTSLMKNFVGLPYIFTKAGYTWDHIKQYPSLIELLQSENALTDFRKKLGIASVYSKWRDHYTFDHVWKIFQMNSAVNKPFAISTVSIDGHMPNGFVSEETLKYPGRKHFPPDSKFFQLLDANYNCDHHLGLLVDRILTSPQGKNTIVVIANDHLFMGSAGKVLDKKKRKNILMIINGGKSGLSNTPGCNLDIPSTIVDLFKIKSNYKFPCGVSLLDDSHQTSVKERMNICRTAGIEFLNKYIVSKNDPGKAEKENKNISIIERDNILYLHFFEQESVLRNSSELFRVDLDKNNQIKAATYFLEFFGRGIEKKRTKTALSDKNSYIFLFHGNTETSNQIFEYLKVSPFPIEWCLLYKRGDGKIMASFAPSIYQLSLDTTVMEKHDISLYFSKALDLTLQHNEIFSWSPKQKINDTAVSLKGKNTYIFSRYSFIAPSPKEIFSYSATVKNTGNESVLLYHGFEFLDKDNKTRGRAHYPANKKAACAEIIRADAGEKRIIVKGSAETWSKGQPLAKNAKPDYSDVPNSNTTKQTITKITKLPDGNTELLMNAPLTETIPPGTLCRPHGFGSSYLYTDIKTLNPGETLNVSGNIKNTDSPILFTNKSLPRGCDRVKVVILSFSKRSGAENTTEISNFKITKK